MAEKFLEMSFTERQFKKWLADHGVETYTRDEWRDAFKTEPPDERGNPTFVETSEFIRALGRAKGQPPSDVERPRDENALEALRAKKRKG